MDLEKSSSKEEEEGLSNLDFLFDLSDLSEGITVFSERLIAFADSMTEELERLDTAQEERPEVLPRLSNYARVIPAVYVSDATAYSATGPAMATVPDFMDFAEIVSGGDYFFI